jgi:putative glutamine amidotransferase
MGSRIAIGVSKLSPNYASWLNQLHDKLEIIDLYSLPPEEVIKQLSSVSGILLTGGSDIHPGLYGRHEDLPYCRNIDVKRDEMEAIIIGLAFKFNKPLLGICRGQQVINVVRKGTLYADINAFVNTTIVHADQEDVYHPVSIREDSLLFRLTGISAGSVNSAHHQAVNNLAKGFLASAFSPDGLIEAIEADNTIDHPFCLAVQWHPERMEMENPLSGLLGRGFINEVMK